MPKKKILTIGFDICSEETKTCSFNSDLSLLDWDIILFKPDISEFFSFEFDYEIYQGKPCFSESASFRLKERVEHWRREIKTALENGKSVVVYLSALEEVLIDTGQRTYSGSGRNQITTRKVTPFDNYRSIPLELNPVKTNGTEIKLSGKNSELISTYWHEFSSYSKYKVFLNDEVPSCLITKHGDKPVGAIVRSKNSAGNLILLPDIDFNPSEFMDEESEWTKEAKRFGSRFVKSIVSLDKSLKSSGEQTPEPEWAKDNIYKLDEESALTTKLLNVESKLEKVQEEKESYIEKIKNLGRLRNLLFEKGKPLEYAILDALKVLGFSVSQYDDGESEFDAVFQSKEGRLIGEAEGKDNKAINIDKLRQLTLNIHEDLERDEVEEPAKAVLFGNPFRLQPLVERNDPFTTKCISAAKISSVALVFTPDFFEVAKYLMDKRDVRFATKCRKSLLNAVGRVEFPVIPKSNVGTSQTNQVEN